MSACLVRLITRHAGNCWRSRDELIRDVLLWTRTHGRAKAGRPARTYIQQLCEDTGCCPEDLPGAVNDRVEWRERVRDIRATSATWWWYINNAHYHCPCPCTFSNKRPLQLSNQTKVNVVKFARNLFFSFQRTPTLPVFVPFFLNLWPPLIGLSLIVSVSNDYFFLFLSANISTKAWLVSSYHFFIFTYSDHDNTILVSCLLPKMS